MTIDNKIRHEKLQHEINRAAKKSALPSGKIDKYEYLTGEKMLPNRRQVIKQARFTYSRLGKALEKQAEKQVDPLKSLNLSNKTKELKQIESIFPQNQINDLIIDRLKEIIQLENSIKPNKLDYKPKIGKHNLSKISLPIICLRNICKEVLSIKDTDEEQSKLLKELGDMNKVKTQSKSLF